MTAILFDATKPVQTNRSFGRGILPTAPVYQADYSASDASWWAAECAAAEQAELDHDADQMAAEREWQARYEAGRLTDEDVIIATGCCG
jgi:hypothetical protein